MLRRAAAALTAVVLVVGLTHNSWSAGGSDEHAYVSQADLWLKGDLKVAVPLADEVPWPDALDTFTPIGYRTIPNASAITPVTGPGLPLLMAAFKFIGGHAAAFLIAPLSGALLVWTTFLIGRGMGSDVIGLGGAWLVATSPTFLMIYRSPISDMPAAAFWALATYWIMGGTVSRAIAAGIAASIAILIRPNLVPIAASLAVGAFMMGRVKTAPPRLAPVVAFSIATLPGCLAVAAINHWLYGSPLSSGYGDLSTIFSLANIPISLGKYSVWLIETQTPLAAAGLVVLAIAPRRIWPTPVARTTARLLAGVAVTAWGLYSLYPAYNAWWFLRFLLPSWPGIFIGTAAAVVWLCDGRGTWANGLIVASLLTLGLYGVVITTQRGVFPAGEGERRYATIATLVQQQTEPSAMVLAAIHAGALHYYSGRTTVRFDLLDEEWLDRAVDWLALHGHHPYLLIEDWEVPQFTKRFSGASRLGDLRLAPLLVYRAYQISGRVYLFDLLRPDGPTLEPPPIRDPRPRAPLPAGT